MSRSGCAGVAAALLGILTGLVIIGAVLGVQMRRHEPGLWTVRFQRILDCGVDYNGPPYTNGGMDVWLTCGSEDRSWRLWPPGGD